MKKTFVLIGMMIIICVGIGFFPQKEKQDYDYLRLHIRANSNHQVDQNIKYKIKDVLVEFLTPYFSNVANKEQAVEVVNEVSLTLENKCNNILKENGLDYSANIKINNEYFPTRTYENVTLESGYYDAVIVELGSAEGDNWWCVMYPPLCFVNKNSNNIQINFKSKIVEIINHFKN